MSHIVTVKERKGGIYTQDVNIGPHHLYADEPESYGSADLGPAPYELLCAALGACTSITLRMYAERKNWPVSQISVDVIHQKRSDAEHGFKDEFIRKLTLKGDLDEAQSQRLLQIAERCPVHRTLEGGAHIITELSD